MSASPPAPPKNTFDFSAAAGDGLFIGISGLIGAGKTTLATALAEELNLPVYYEPVTDNVYLADFYNDIAKYAFPMQVYLLNKRFKQQQQIIWEGRGGFKIEPSTKIPFSLECWLILDSCQLEIIKRTRIYSQTCPIS